MADLNQAQSEWILSENVYPLVVLKALKGWDNEMRYKNALYYLTKEGEIIEVRIPAKLASKTYSVEDLYVVSAKNVETNREILYAFIPKKEKKAEEEE